MHLAPPDRRRQVEPAIAGLLRCVGRDARVGPTGLGLLSERAGGRGAPRGWLLGRWLLGAVALFGASYVVFGLLRWFPVSLTALVVSGFADMISINIRSTAVALATPERAPRPRQRGRERFINASNQLGAFESGAAAALV